MQSLQAFKGSVGYDATEKTAKNELYNTKKLHISETNQFMEFTNSYEGNLFKGYCLGACQSMELQGTPVLFTTSLSASYFDPQGI